MARIITIIVAGLVAQFCWLPWALAETDAGHPEDMRPEIPAHLLRLAPPPADGPVVVKVAIEIDDINQINEVEETFEFTGALTLEWQDTRLAFRPTAGVDEQVYSGEYQFDEVATGWYPTVALANESGSYELSNMVLRIQPDGTSTLVQRVQATAEVDLDMKLFPFDAHRLEAVFELVGFSRDEVQFQSVSNVENTGLEIGYKLPQWLVTDLQVATRDGPSRSAAHGAASSVLVVTVDVERDSFYMRRLVTLPLSVIVMLSFSVFWMNRSSLGDRINVSFIGILTGVSYQLVMGGIIPQVSYFTLIHAFLISSFLTMCATVVINLWVGALDKNGQYELGDKIDWHCRWIFPLFYIGFNGVMYSTRDLFL